MYIVSNGSFFLDVKKGAAAWVIIAYQNHRFFLMGNNLCTGPRESQCSHRSELSGIIGDLKYWDRIKKGHSVDDVKVIFKCDRLEAVVVALRWHYSPSFNIS